MDDMTLIVAPESADKCVEALSHTLTEAGMKLNEDKCTAWTTDDNPPDAPRALTLWSQAKDHKGLHRVRLPRELRNPDFEAPLAIPAGNPEYIDDFLKTRKDNLDNLFSK